MHAHPEGHESLGTNTTARLSLCDAGVSYDIVNYVYAATASGGRCVSVCARCINQAFLGTLISISNSSLERRLKEGRQLISYMGEPLR